MADEPRNYFRGSQQSDQGLKYRLDARDVIRDVCDTLSGISRDKYGRPIENESLRLMNEEGVYAARFFLQGSVNKIAHLTKYENEERIMRQMRAQAHEWIKNVALNKKRWDVKHKGLVVQVVENAILQSMQRGNEGFEASLTGKGWQVSELVDTRPQQPQGFFSFLRPRGPGGNNG